MRVCHIWSDYSPDLFDKTHSICQEKSIKSDIACARLIDPQGSAQRSFHYLYKIDPKFFSRTSLSSRLINKLKIETSNLRFKHFLPKLVAQINPTLLHVHFGHTAIQLHQFLETSEVPFIISFYGVDISSELKNSRSIKIYRRLLKRARKVIVLCSEARSRLQLLDCAEEKIVTWNIPVDGQTYPLRTLARKSPIRFLMAARFVEKKGHQYALEAFKELATLRQDVHLTLFGYGPSEWIARLISEHELQGRCTLINNQFTANFKADYYSLLLEHDIFLEQFPKMEGRQMIMVLSPKKKK